MLSRTCRAPSYKAIAMAILNNDVSLKGLGIVGPEAECYRSLKNEAA